MDGSARAAVVFAHLSGSSSSKVLDFGIAKIESGVDIDTTTKTGSLLGTPFYMSPEQAQGMRSLDYRSDLWALAVVTYQCLTGTLPFRGMSGFAQVLLDDYRGVLDADGVDCLGEILGNA